MSCMGVLIATFSVTGVLIWARKRRSRAYAAARQPQALPGGALGSTSS